MSRKHFLILVLTIINIKISQVQILHPIKFFDRFQKPILNTYDFIIVGGGSSGCVIANRLSEIPHWKILLLEAGDEEDKLFEIPVIVSILQHTKYNWRHFMEYQPGVVLGCEKNLMPWPRGKALGGTSVINYMIYSRAQRQDFDKWAAQGNPGWSYNDVLPYFIKSEDCGLKNADYRYHGVGGYLSVEDVYQSKISYAFIQGMQELGLPYIDYNANTTLGVSTLQGTVNGGKRHSVAKAFIKPVIRRPNLHVVTKAFVTKILINSKTKTAYGVEFTRFGQKYKVNANKEVILSAGTFASPQLLMLSGIGPKEHLDEIGIPVIKNLNVGQNLQENWAFLGLSFLTDQRATLYFSQILAPNNIYEFVINGTGPLNCLGGAQSVAYIKTEISEEIGDNPDIELLLVGTSLAFDYGIFLRSGMGITDDVYNAVYRPLEGKNSFMIIPMLLHPRSKGFIKLRSKNPEDYPLIYGNIFTDSKNKDMETFLASIRYAQRLLQTKSFKQYNVTINPNPVPGCTQHKFNSDSYWRCTLKYLVQTLHHPVGTVKMGPKNDVGAVVNQHLKVYGIERLRVADCSIIPFALGGHTNAPAIMVGEKAADIIKTTWVNHK